MKILSATTETQGWRANDFCHAVEGELVLFVPSCDGESIDGDCGCRRAMAGSVSHRATTTIKVIDRNDLNPNKYFTLIADSLESQGYINERMLTDPEVNEWVQDLTDDLIRLANFYPVGTVLERRGDVMRSRTKMTEDA